MDQAVKGAHAEEMSKCDLHDGICTQGALGSKQVRCIKYIRDLPCLQPRACQESFDGFVAHDSRFVDIVGERAAVAGLSKIMQGL